MEVKKVQFYIGAVAISIMVIGICCGDGGKKGCSTVYKSEECATGFITSPNFPLAYPNGSICTYEFIANGSERIQLNFVEFSLTYSGSFECYYSDTIEIFMHVDGKYRPVHVFCGSRLPSPVMSYSERMLMEFRGVDGGHSIGFKIEFKFLRGKSPNFPGIYPVDIVCNYFFNGNEDEQVQINFTYFDVEGVYPCDEEFSSDSIELSNYESRDRKFQFYCGHLEKGFSVTSDGRFFRVTFRSNSIMDGTGFKGSFRFTRLKTRKITFAVPLANIASSRAMRSLRVLCVFCVLLSVKRVNAM